MTSLDQIERKWYEETRASVERAIASLKEDATFDEYVRALAAIEGMPSESQIRASPAAAKWKRGVERITADSVMQSIQRAHDQGKWKNGFRKAFS